MRSRSLSERSTPSRGSEFCAFGTCAHHNFSLLSLWRGREQWSGWPIPLSMKFVMSTILLIGRWPMARRRLRSHSGDFTSTLRIVTAEYLGHPSLSSRVYFHCSVGAVGSERLNRGHADFGMADSVSLCGIAGEEGLQVACHAIVGGCVNTIWSSSTSRQ